jgi:hypothetical protein
MILCKVSLNIVYVRIKNAVRGISVSNKHANPARHTTQKYTAPTLPSTEKKNTPEHGRKPQHRIYYSEMLQALTTNHGLEHIPLYGYGNSTVNIVYAYRVSFPEFDITDYTYIDIRI